MVCCQTIRIRRFCTSPLVLLVGLLLASGGIGCGGGGKDPSASDPEAVHIVKVAELVKEYESAHKEIPPGSLQELKSWAIEQGKAQESDFVSTRDNEAYVLEVSGGGKPKKGSQIDIREATGKNRKKFMAVGSPPVATEMDDSYFNYMSGGLVRDAKKKYQPK